jgi:hypothetical protein
MARDVSSVVLLATSATRPLAILQLDFMVDGRYESGRRDHCGDDHGDRFNRQILRTSVRFRSLIRLSLA